jgi:hypothetical protein
METSTMLRIRANDGHYLGIRGYVDYCVGAGRDPVGFVKRLALEVSRDLVAVAAAVWVEGVVLGEEGGREG